ncbi:hypothetical protein HPP92_002002 [Vanilla planifolia]|uniref:Uncharacterized protein n=1 Tax=Vanilla planifolia TaxID=51239 RepID=A0A835RZB8_VANPL|nr:hypothetical protein HPP92_002002 [Vanilla planifolia]
MIQNVPHLRLREVLHLRLIAEGTSGKIGVGMPFAAQSDLDPYGPELSLPTKVVLMRTIGTAGDTEANDLLLTALPTISICDGWVGEEDPTKPAVHSLATG